MTDVNELKAGSGSVDPDDFNALVDAVKGSGGLPSGGTTGQVLTKESNADQDAGWEDAGGGSQTLVWVNMRVAFDTPGLRTGLPFYTPAESDVLLAHSGFTPIVWEGNNAQPIIVTGFGTDLANGVGFFTCSVADASPNPLIEGRETIQYTSIGPAGVAKSYRFADATPLVIYVDDGNGSDPGESLIWMLIGKAPS